MFQFIGMTTPAVNRGIHTLTMDQVIPKGSIVSYYPIVNTDVIVMQCLLPNGQTLLLSLYNSLTHIDKPLYLDNIAHYIANCISTENLTWTSGIMREYGHFTVLPW